MISMKTQKLHIYHTSYINPYRGEAKMQYSGKLIQGKFLKRYKRFFVDVLLDNHEIVTAHCPNTGSMMGLKEEGFLVRLTQNDDPKRKLKFTLEQVNPGSGWVGVNTNLPNKVVKEALENKEIPELSHYDIIETEKKYGQNSRIDILLTNSKNGEICYVEIKNVTLSLQAKEAAFPDAVTERGRKHMQELTEMVKKGHKACIFYLINRTDCDKVTLADEIDPKYAEAFKEATAAGVICLAYSAKLTETEIKLEKKIDVTYG